MLRTVPQTLWHVLGRNRKRQIDEANPSLVAKCMAVSLTVIAAEVENAKLKISPTRLVAKAAEMKSCSKLQVIRA